MTERVEIFSSFADLTDLPDADIERLDGDEIRRRLPWISPGVAVGAFGGGWIDGQRATELFAEASGGPILHSTRVAAIETNNGVVTGVAANRDRIATDKVVLAAGPFSKTISPEPLLVALERRRVIVSPSRRIPQHGPMTIDANTGAQWRPHQGGALIAWAQPVTDAPAEPGFPDLVLKDERGIGRIASFWREPAHDLAGDQISLTAGQHTVTPDHKPLIGPANETVGLWLNTGHSGHGIEGSPNGSRLLPDLTSGRLWNDANPFHPGLAAGSKPSDLEHIVLSH